jgi:hypothetical protein
MNGYFNPDLCSERAKATTRFLVKGRVRLRTPPQGKRNGSPKISQLPSFVVALQRSENGF